MTLFLNYMLCVWHDGQTLTFLCILKAPWGDIEVGVSLSSMNLQFHPSGLSYHLSWCVFTVSLCDHATRNCYFCRLQQYTVRFLSENPAVLWLSKYKHSILSDIPPYQHTTFILWHFMCQSHKKKKKKARPGFLCVSWLDRTTDSIKHGSSLLKSCCEAFWELIQKFQSSLQKLSPLWS